MTGGYLIFGVISGPLTPTKILGTYRNSKSNLLKFPHSALYSRVTQEVEMTFYLKLNYSVNSVNPKHLTHNLPTMQALHNEVK